MRIGFGLALALLAADAGDARSEVLLQSGDRIVFVGDTFAERDQAYGFLETALTSRFVDRDFQFRNVGWSADTTTGLSRTYFDPPEKGRERLIEDVLSNKPTVLLVGYGMSESFDGADGLERFQENLAKFLGDTTQEVRRTVLISPVRHERLREALPDPTPHNRSLQTYAQAIAETAAARGDGFIDLFSKLETPRSALPLTDNGIHLSEAGYWLAALEIERQLGVEPQSIVAELSANGPGSKCENTAVADVAGNDRGLSFTLTDARLPTPVVGGLPALLDHPQAVSITVTATGLAPGQYALTSEGETYAVADHRQWAAGVRLADSPQHRQANELREAINRKNAYYFQQYRPQNITYLLGFRRYEQGQNAEEIERLAEYVRKAEEEISRLKVPAPVRFELAKTN